MLKIVYNVELLQSLAGGIYRRYLPPAFTGGICHRHLPANTGMDNTPKSGIYWHL